MKYKKRRAVLLLDNHFFFFSDEEAHMQMQQRFFRGNPRIGGAATPHVVRFWCLIRAFFLA